MMGGLMQDGSKFGPPQGYPPASYASGTACNGNLVVGGSNGGNGGGNNNAEIAVERRPIKSAVSQLGPHLTVRIDNTDDDDDDDVDDGNNNGKPKSAHAK